MLAADVARADASQFVDRQAVEGLLAGSYRAISEFCGKEIFQQRYPKLLALLMRSPITTQTNIDYGVYPGGLTNYASMPCIVNSENC